MKTSQFTLSLLLMVFTCAIGGSYAEGDPNHKTFFIPFGTGINELGYIPFDENMAVYGEAKAPLIMEGPTAFNVDDSGALYFLDIAANAVRKYNQDGELLISGELPRLDNLEPTYSDLQLVSPNLVFLSDIENNRFILFNIENGEIIQNITLPKRELKNSYKERNESELDILRADETRTNTLEVEEKEEESFFTPYYLEDFRVLDQNNILFRDLYDNSIYALKNEAPGKLIIQKVNHSEEIQLNLHQYQNGAYAGFSTAIDDPEEIIIYALNDGNSKKLFTSGHFAGLGFFELIAVEHDSIALAFYMGGEAGVDLRELRIYKANGTLLARKSINIPQLSWQCEKQVRYKNGLLYVLEYEEKSNGMKIHLISF